MSTASTSSFPPHSLLSQSRDRPIRSVRAGRSPVLFSSPSHVFFAKVISAMAKTSTPIILRWLSNIYLHSIYFPSPLCPKDGLVHFLLDISRACCIQLSMCVWNQAGACRTTELALLGCVLCQWIARVCHVPSCPMMLGTPCFLLHTNVWHQHANVCTCKMSRKWTPFCHC